MATMRLVPRDVPHGTQGLLYNVTVVHMCFIIIIIIIISCMFTTGYYCLLLFTIAYYRLLLSRGGQGLLVLPDELLGALLRIKIIDAYSLQRGAVGGGCSGWGWHYIINWYITSYKSLHPVSTAPPFDES